MMKGLLYLLIITSLISQAGYGQKQTNNWIFGYNQGITFNGGAPTAITAPDPALRNREGCASISDTAGNLLFYTDGKTVWNRNHLPMVGGNNTLNGDSASTMSALITPYPGNDSLYYIFTIDTLSSALTSKGFQYHLVNMNHAGGLGEVVSANNPLLGGANVCEKVIGIQHRNANDYWVITHGFGGNTFYVFKITCAGLDINPATYSLGNTITTAANAIGYMKASPDRKKIATAGFTSVVEVFDFDDVTGAITNDKIITGNPGNFCGPYGVEFSPDSKLLYVSEIYACAGTGTSTLMQYEVNAADIALTRQIIKTTADLTATPTALLLGPDGIIYVADDEDHLGAITNPNTIGLGCNYVRNYLPLPSNSPIGGAGLPNMVAGYRKLLGKDSTMCEGVSYAISLNEFTPGIASFFWDDNSALSTRTIIGTAGTHKYWVRITTSSGCTYSDTVTLTFKPKPALDLGVDQAICADKFPITLASPTTPGGVTYLWSDAVTTGNTFSVNSANKYWVDVTLDGCTISDTVNITSKAVTPFDLGPDRTICGTTPQTLTVTPAFASYKWNTTEVAGSISISATGKYYVDATNALGCLSSDTISVLYKPNPVVDIGTDQAICADKFPIVLTQPVIGGATYKWGDGSANNTFTVNGAGSYTIDVDLNGCVLNGTVNVTSKPVTAFDLGPDLTICGTTPQTLTVAPAFASYVWNTGVTAGSISVNATGKYWVDATNASGCQSSDTINVLYKPNPVVDIGTDQAICANKFPIILTQPTIPGATYTWSNGTTSNTLTVNGAATYFVDVDLNGCVLRGTVNVTSKPVTAFDLGPALTICGTTPRTLTVTPAFASYVWSTGATAGNISVNATGKYWVDATNASGCQSSDTINVLYKPNPVVDIGTDQAICANEFPIVLTQPTIPGAAYTWSDATKNNTLTVNAAGTYFVDVDLNGCVLRGTVNVTSKPVTAFNLGPDLTICGTTPQTLTVTPAFASYVWSTGDATGSISVNASGKYYVDATNASGCQSTDTINVLYKPNPVVDIGANQAICADKFPIVLTQATIPGATYTWNNGTTNNTLTVNGAGNYFVDVDLNGCTIRGQVGVTSRPVTPFDLGPDLTICGTAPQTLTVTPAFGSYRWSTGAVASNITVNTNGKYWVDATNASGCQSTDTINVLYKPNPVVDIGTDQAICADKFPVVLTQATIPGATYAWNDGSTNNTLTVNGAGNYSVAVNLNGCIVNGSVNVTSKSVTPFNLGPDLSVCGTGAQILTVNPVYTAYAWSTGETASSISINASGTYWADAVNSSGCKSSDTINVVYKPKPVVDIGANQAICADKFPIILTQATIPGATYVWNDGSTNNTLQVNGAGLYALDVTLNGCTASNEVTVTSKPVTSFSLGADTSICGNQNVQLSIPTGFTSYLWSTGATGNNISINTTGNYWVEAVNSSGCAYRDDISVTLNSALAFSLGSDTIICQGSALLLDVSGAGTSYKWQDNSTGPQFTVTTAGKYFVEVNKTGCIKADTIVVGMNAVPQPNLGPDQQMCPGQVIILDPGASAKSYLWQDGSRTATYKVTTPGLYTVAIANECGTATDEVDIEKGVCRLALPNAFTPDKNQNNIFRLINGYEVKGFRMEIYNRWGQQLFLSQNAGVGWNGVYGGVKQPAGTYVYSVSYVDETGKKVLQRGTVILIR